MLRDAISLSRYFDSYHDYSEHITAFLHSLWLIGSVYNLDLRKLSDRSSIVSSSEADAMNYVLEKIRMCSMEEWFQRAEYDRRWECRQKAENVRLITEKILLYYSRTMIVRVDFSYKKEASSWITVDHLYNNLDELLRIKNWHAVFQNLVGYAWAIEQGERQGFHMHAAFYFDGSKECRDVYKGFEISELWIGSIANGVGKAHVCNASKENYDEGSLAIGVIDRLDDQACLNAINHIPYIAKDTQYLRVKPKGRRAFGTGSVPDINLKKGRPPRRTPSWISSEHYPL